MSDEAEFLRAIQANPADNTAKLVYADWLEERGESEKSEYLRLHVTAGGAFKNWNEQALRFNLLARRHRVWVELVRGTAPLWDAVTAFTLGRLQGLLDGYASLNGHESDISYDFGASLLLPSPTFAETVELALSGLGPVNLEPFDNWEASVAQVFDNWLFRELRQLSNQRHTRLAMLSEPGRDWIVADVLAHIRAVINPTAGWQLRVTPTGFYALDWTDVALEAADRVLFLHFSFSD